MDTSMLNTRALLLLLYVLPVASLPQSLTGPLGKVVHQKEVIVNLLGNPLECTCEHLECLRWLASSPVVFPNTTNYTCVDRDGHDIHMDSLSDLVRTLEKICPSYTGLIVVCTLWMSLFLLALVGVIVYRYCRTKKRIRGYEAIPTVDPVDDYTYGAYVSCADEQLHFIRNEMIVHLEEELQVHLCIEQRDFELCSSVADNIVNAIKRSRKTIVLLTNDHLQRSKYWLKFTIDWARRESMYSRDGRPIILVIVLTKDLDRTTLPLELLELINSDSCIEYPDEAQGKGVFWERVKDAIMN